MPSIITNTHVTPQSWVVSWCDFQLISLSQAVMCLVGYMSETNRHPLQKCASSKVIITSKSPPVSLCANSRRRQADVLWALARPRAHISGEGRNGVSNSGRLITRCFRYTLIPYPYKRLCPPFPLHVHSVFPVKTLHTALQTGQKA